MTPDPNTDDNRIFFFDRARIVRPGGRTLFDEFSWTVSEGESWAIVGPTGSGKTSLAQVILGRLHLAGGDVVWPFIERLRASGRVINWPTEVIQVLSFKEESRLFSSARHYYQQRFNFIEPEDDLTLEAFLRAGNTADDDHVRDVATKLGVESLRSLSLIKLSNGQMRRGRLAKAMLSKPELLILDEPFMGLDVAGRGDISSFLGELIRHGTRILLITRPETIPDWVTHRLPISGFGFRVSDSGPRLETPRGDVPSLEGVSAGIPIVELRNVSVAYDGKPILQDVSWTVRSGERWAVLGPNGSGKTTLLSLICGDHPQAYSNDIRLFGQQRGTGESIWDIKRRVGLISPEMHLYFSEPLTAIQTAATGFFDVLARRPTTRDQDATIRELFRQFNILHIADELFARLSTGEQRLVLLVRALVKSPPLLILDEPFQGLDGVAIERLRDWLDRSLRADQTLIFVSHFEDEIPRTVNRRLHLEAGRIAPASNQTRARENTTG